MMSFFKDLTQLLELLIGETLLGLIGNFLYGAFCGSCLVALYYIGKWTLLLLFAPLLN